MGSRDGGSELPEVLIVDDERDVADAYALRLDGLCSVETVYDGETALRAVEERPVESSFWTATCRVSPATRSSRSSPTAGSRAGSSW
jgi:CheY-like chemotaxis protein